MPKSRNLVITVALMGILFLPASSRSDTLETQWMVALLQGKKVGHLHTVRRARGDSIITENTFELQLGRGSSAAVTCTEKVHVYETSDGRPLGFRMHRTTGKAVQWAEGTICDSAKTLYLKTGQPGDTASRREIRWPDGAVLYEGARQKVKSTPVRQGRTLEYTTFSCTVLDFERVAVTVGPPGEVLLQGITARLYPVEKASTVGTTRVVETSFVNTDWVEKKCVVDIGSLKLELIDCSREAALADNDQFDIIQHVMITAPDTLCNPSAARSCTYQFIVPRGTVLPESDEQAVRRITDSTLQITVTRPRNDTVSGKPPDVPTDVKAFIRPSRHIESDDPEIIAMARKIVGNTSSRSAAVEKIRAFTHSYIKTKSMDVGFASAREVLTLKEGDCTEHAVFTAALCRAAGIPARVVMGIVRPPWSSVYFHHAWTQVYVDNRWKSIDSALEGFHPGYIAFSHDAGENAFLGLGKLLGTVRITKVKCAE